MTNDWYVSAVHSYVKPEYEGYLICGYADGTSKSYYWNKSTLTDGDFTTTLASDEDVTWVMNLDGCVKKIDLYGGHNFSCISHILFLFFFTGKLILLTTEAKVSSLPYLRK